MMLVMTAMMMMTKIMNIMCHAHLSQPFRISRSKIRNAARKWYPLPSLSIVTVCITGITLFSFLLWRLLLSSRSRKPPSDMNSVAHSLCQRTSHVTRHASQALLLMRARIIMKEVLGIWQRSCKKWKRVQSWTNGAKFRMQNRFLGFWIRLFAR